jgi:hypothetical protein
MERVLKEIGLYLIQVNALMSLPLFLMLAIMRLRHAQNAANKFMLIASIEIMSGLQMNYFSDAKIAEWMSHDN